MYQNMYFWKSVSTCTSANYIATSAEVSPNCGSRESPQMSLVRVQELNIHTYCILIFHLPRCMECWSFQLETFHQTHGFSPAKHRWHTALALFHRNSKELRGGCERQGLVSVCVMSYDVLMAGAITAGFSFERRPIQVLIIVSIIA